MTLVIVILALLGMLAIGAVVGCVLAALDEVESGMLVRRTGQGCLATIDTQNVHRYESEVDRSSATKTRAGAYARAIYIAPKMVLPHGDTEIIDLVGWKSRRAR